MRMTLPSAAPAAYQALVGIETYLRSCGLENSLYERVKLRASRINRCAFCIDMHSKHARKAGETEQRLYLLNGWREAPLYTEREPAALAWTEHRTRLPNDGAPEAAYQRLRAVFSDTEIADLTLPIGMIDLWNRVGVGFHLAPAA